MDRNERKILTALSVIILITAGHFFAKYVSINKSTAWIYVVLFYGAWIVLSLITLLKSSELKQMFVRGIKWHWNFVPFLFIIPTFIFIFIPNIHLLKPDRWLLFNTVLCLLTPFVEEIYWRGLIYKVFRNNLVLSFLISTFGFALSHPLIFGVNSRGDSGWLGFTGTFIAGAVWWLCYHKTKSLRGNILTHFLMDVAGMAVYILTNKATLMF